MFRQLRGSVTKDHPYPFRIRNLSTNYQRGQLTSILYESMWKLQEIHNLFKSGREVRCWHLFSRNLNNTSGLSSSGSDDRNRTLDGMFQCFLLTDQPPVFSFNPRLRNQQPAQIIIRCWLTHCYRGQLCQTVPNRLQIDLSACKHSSWTVIPSQFHSVCRRIETECCDSLPHRQHRILQ